MPFKLSVVTDEISQDFDHALAVARELEAEGVALRTLWGKNIVDLSDEEVRRAGDALRRHHLELTAIALPFLKASLYQERASARPAAFFVEERSHEEHFATLSRALELARLLDCPVVRTFSFWREPEPTDGDWQRIAEHLRRAVGLAHAEGRLLALENEHTCNAATGAETRRLLEDVGSPALKVIWDPANALCAGEVPYPYGFEQVRAAVVDVHVKDCFVDPDSNEYVYCLLGEGGIDWPEQVQALLTGGYSGPLTVETHPIVGIPPEEATRQTFARLWDMIRRAGA